MTQNLFFYRFTRPVTLLMQREGRYRLVQVPAGSLVETRSATPDENGMIEGTLNATSVMMFSIDLDQRAEFIPARNVQRAELPVQKRTA